MTSLTVGCSVSCMHNIGYLSRKQHLNFCCLTTRIVEMQKTVIIYYAMILRSLASDVQDFNSRRPKGLNGDSGRVQPPDHENRSLNGQKRDTKPGRSRKVSLTVEKLQQSVAKLDFLTKCIKTWKQLLLLPARSAR